VRAVGERGDGPADEVVEAYRANESAIERRREALSEGFRRAPVTIATAGRMSQSARKLASAEDTVALLERYRTLDERFALLEQAVASVDIEWDRMVQHELDLARGTSSATAVVSAKSAILVVENQAGRTAPGQAQPGGEAPRWLCKTRISQPSAHRRRCPPGAPSRRPVRRLEGFERDLHEILTGEL
jgi:hypothetical protein